MKYRLQIRGAIVAECVNIGGTLYVHYYDSRGSYTYEFGKWPKGKYLAVELK